MKSQLLSSAIVASLLLASSANAQSPEPPPAPYGTPPPPLAPAPPQAMPLTGPPKGRPRTLFAADPVIDGSVLLLSAGWAVLSTLIIGTGEIRPQQISPDFKTDHLLPLDRDAVNQTIDPNAKLLSNIGLGIAIGYTGIDTIASGFRERDPRASLVDGMIYAEAIAITSGATNLSKLAVRRPRPIAYVEFRACRKKHPESPCDNTSTDSALSFVSGHASTTGAVWGAATYLAFARSPRSVRPWFTLFGGMALTAFVSFERVRSGDHFPTDVIAGSFAGAGVGVITAHWHRDDSSKLRPLWVGWQNATLGDGGALTLNTFL